jgi:hypothetical protein
MTKESYADGKPDCEYFCTDCLQLRLSFLINTYKCGNCNSNHIIIGSPGQLDKEELIEKHRIK